MKRLLIILLALVSIVVGKINAQTEIDRKSAIESLTTIDPDIRRYFPRWKICEDDIKMQVYQAFVLLGYDKSKLSMQQIEVLAAPRESEYDSYELLLITCGELSMNSVEIEANLGRLADYISGLIFYNGPNRGEKITDGRRDYCYNDMDVSMPTTETQVAAIKDYLEPSNATHAITLSLFEQALKIGESGFWIRAVTGNDQVGYPFWQAGESKIVLQRPLYVNKDLKTVSKIPYLINAYIGGSYRITSGIDNDGTMFSWLKNRKLNSGQGGKLVFGFDFNMPFKPEAGIHFNIDMPLTSIKTQSIDDGSYAYLTVNQNGADDVDIIDQSNPPAGGNYKFDNQVVPILRASGQATIFYNLWLNEKNPENFLRFDVGLSYCEVDELAVYRDLGAMETKITPDYFYGLKTYKPNEVGDWMYLKVEYRNQAAFPFGMSAQYSNQMFLGRVYIPLFGNWLYLEGKYATPLRGVRPYEEKNYFMISPLLRITI